MPLEINNAYGAENIGKERELAGYHSERTVKGGSKKKKNKKKKTYRIMPHEKYRGSRIRERGWDCKEMSTAG